MKIAIGTRKLLPAAGVIILGTGILGATAACGSNSTSAPQKAESENTSHQQAIYNQVQPIHQYPYSELRGTLQYYEDVEARGDATWSYDVNANGTLDFACPSIGMPVHATDQLSNPLVPIWSGQGSRDGYAGVAVGQMENTGVYPGNSSGTAAVCVQPDGNRYLDYFEGYAHVLTARSHWDFGKNQIVVDGDAATQPPVQH